MVSPTLVPSNTYHQSHNSANQPSAPSGYDELNINSVLDKLRGNKTSVRPEQEVLILANIKRADRFVFHKNRQEKLRPEQVQQSASNVQDQAQSHHTQPPDPPFMSRRQSDQSITPSSHAKAGAPSSQQSTGTTNQASDFKPNSSLENVTKVEKPVVAPGVAATTIARRADYPKPPKDTTRCPYCFIPFRSEAKDMLQWK
jgi:hypothetical protein